jgi:hypothetical protein
VPGLAGDVTICHILVSIGRLLGGLRGSGVTDDVTATVVVDGGCTGPNRTTTLRLAWSRRDPLAVRLLLTAEPDHPALPRGRWSVLRDFLRNGCNHPTGDGLVRIEPTADRKHVVLRLVDGGRVSRVQVAADVVARFLDATEEICPAGEERHDLAIDAVIDRLLAT